MGWFDAWFGPPSRKQFAQLLTDEMKRAGDRRSVRFDESEFRLYARQGEGEHQINLANLYAEYCQAPAAERKSVIRRFAAAAMVGSAAGSDVPDDWDSARPNIRPKIWLRASLALMELQVRADGGTQLLDLPDCDLGSHLSASVVYDLPHSMMSISNEQLQQWGVSAYEAIEAARENLSEVNCSFAEVGEGLLYCSATGDNYDASRILLPELVERFTVEGDLVAMIPHRDSLLVTGSRSDPGLVAMVSLAEEILKEQPRPMSPFPLRLVGEDWVDFQLPEGHPAREKLDRMAVQYWHGVYQEQKALLEKIYERDHVNRFVATYSGMQQKENGPIVSFSVWGEGVETLLPKTDKIALVRGNSQEFAGLASWEQVARVVGDRLEPQSDLYPPRFLVDSFPTDEELARIGHEKI